MMNLPLDAWLMFGHGAAIHPARVREHVLGAGFAKRQLPDRVAVIDAIPRTGVGKFDTKVLRARFSDAPATEGSA